MPGTSEFLNLGGSVSGAGDVNDDGLDDVVISAEGRGYVLFGSAAEFAPSIDLNALSTEQGFSMIVSDGIASVSRAGDINDDGVDDVILGTF